MNPGIYYIIFGIVLIVVSSLFLTGVISGFEPYTNSDNDFQWKLLGKASWLPIFGNAYVYNNTLLYKKLNNHYRYRIETPNGGIYDISQIHKLHNGEVIQIANPTNPMSVELAIQI